MIRLLIIVVSLLFLIAVIPSIISDPGYISIAFLGHIFELTVFTAIFWLTVLFFTITFTYKFFRGTTNLGIKGWNKIAFAGRRKGLKNLKMGLSAYVLEDYAKAEHLLAKAAEPSQFEQMSYLLAAAAAEKQALPSNTAHYLKLADSYDNTIKNSGLEAIIVKTKLLINQEKYKEARQLIDEHHKFLGHDERFLSLEIDLCIIEQRFHAANEHLKAARKQKEINEQQITNWEKLSFYGEFNQIIKEKSQKALEEHWQQLAKKIKQREEILFSYCLVLAENQIIEPIEKLLQPALKKGASETFVKRLRFLPIANADNLIQLVQKKLHQEPHSAKWLSYLGHLAFQSKQFAMAEKAFNSLFHLEDKSYDKEDLKVCAQIRAAQGNHQGANELLIQLIG